MSTFRPPISLSQSAGEVDMLVVGIAVEQATATITPMSRTTAEARATVAVD
jgi:hypothetical protein